MENEKTRSIWTLAQSKSIQAICIIGIVLHHLAQRTCASWLDESVRRNGLNPFLEIGFLCVAVFFFSSGFGLMTSFRKKENYLKGFFSKRFVPIAVISLIVAAVYMVYGHVGNPYDWYIYAILYFYLCFWLAFRFCKNEKVAVAIIIAATILYCFACDWMVLGGWWLNTVGLFTVGILYARHEDVANAFLCGRRFVLKTVVTSVLFAAAFAGSLFLNASLSSVSTFTVFNICQTIVYVLQFLAALLFVVLILLISSRVQINNKVLNFIGSMTLEIYLIHGFFVQAFSFSFVEDDIEPLVYISNVWLYAVVVLVCSLGSAYLLHIGYKYLVKGIGMLTGFLSSIRKTLIKMGLVVLGIIVVVTGFCVVGNLTGASDVQKQKQAYIDEHLIMVEVNGQMISTYIAGEDGKETVIFIKGENEGLGTLSLKTLADEMSMDYRTIVIDLPGTGFSDNPTSERTLENITEEIHAIIKALKVDEPYVLAPIEASAMYALSYAQSYGQEIKAVVEIDAMNDREFRHETEKLGTTYYELLQRLDFNAESYMVLSGLVDGLGYESFIWPIYENVYIPALTVKEREMAGYVFFDRSYNQYVVEEIHNLDDTFRKTAQMQYPKGMKVVDIVGTFGRYGRRTDDEIAEFNSFLCPDPSDHCVENVISIYDTFYFRPEAIRKMFNKYI